MFRKVKHIGRKALKYSFVITLNQLDVKGTKAWQPYKLVVSLSRKKRKVTGSAQSWRPSMKDPYLGSATWTGHNQKALELTITLFEDHSFTGYERKNWVFVVENESRDGKRKPIATSRLDMAQYTNSLLPSNLVDVVFKPLTNKLVSAKLNCNIACNFLSAGPATEADLVSIAGSTASEDTIRLGGIDNGDIADFDHLDNSRGSSLVGEPTGNSSQTQLELKNLTSQIESLNLAIEQCDPSASGDHLPANNSVLNESGGATRRGHRSSIESGRSDQNSSDATSDAQCKMRSDDDDDESSRATGTVDVRKRSSSGSDASSRSGSFQRRRLLPSADFLPTNHNESDLSSSQSSPAPNKQTSLLRWCQTATMHHEGVKVINFTTSWRNGLALCALIHHFRPDLIDFESTIALEGKSNVKKAMDAVEKLHLQALHQFHHPSSISNKNALISLLLALKSHFLDNEKSPAPSDAKAPLPHIFHRTQSTPHSMLGSARFKLLSDLEEKEMEDDVFSSHLERALGQSPPPLDSQPPLDGPPPLVTPPPLNSPPSLVSPPKEVNTIDPDVRAESVASTSSSPSNNRAASAEGAVSSTSIEENAEPIARTRVSNSPSPTASVPLDVILNSLEVDDERSTTPDDDVTRSQLSSSAEDREHTDLRETDLGGSGNPFEDDDASLRSSDAEPTRIDDVPATSAVEEGESDLDVSIHISSRDIKLSSSDCEHSEPLLEHSTTDVSQHSDDDVVQESDEETHLSHDESENEVPPLDVAPELTSTPKPVESQSGDGDLQKKIEKLLQSSAERTRKARAMEIIAQTKAEMSSSSSQVLSQEELEQQERVRERAQKLIHETWATLGRDKKLKSADTSVEREDDDSMDSRAGKLSLSLNHSSSSSAAAPRDDGSSNVSSPSPDPTHRVHDPSPDPPPQVGDPSPDPPPQIRNPSPCSSEEDLPSNEVVATVNGTHSPEEEEQDPKEHSRIGDPARNDLARTSLSIEAPHPLARSPSPVRSSSPEVPPSPGHEGRTVVVPADVEKRWSSMVQKSSSTSSDVRAISELEAERRGLDAELRLVEERANEVQFEIQEIKQTGRRRNKVREGDLMQEWFQLVNKKHSILRQQDQLALMEEEQTVLQQVETIHEELIPLMTIEESMKTFAQKEREMKLLEEKVRLVNERDRIIQSINEREQSALDEEERLQTTLGENMTKVMKDDEKCVVM